MMYDDLICEFINEVCKELDNRNDDYDDCDWDCESCEFYDECSETDEKWKSGTICQGETIQKNKKKGRRS